MNSQLTPSVDDGCHKKNSLVHFVLRIQNEVLTFVTMLSQKIIVQNYSWCFLTLRF